MVYINGCRIPSFAIFLCGLLQERGISALSGPETIRPAVSEYVNSLRETHARFYSIDDDCVPSAIVYWRIGSITAAMTGGTPTHGVNTSWYEPNLSWSEIGALRFDPDSKQLRLAIDKNRDGTPSSIWRCYNGWAAAAVLEGLCERRLHEESTTVDL